MILIRPRHILLFLDRSFRIASTYRRKISTLSEHNELNGTVFAMNSKPDLRSPRIPGFSQNNNRSKNRATREPTYGSPEDAWKATYFVL